MTDVTKASEKGENCSAGDTERTGSAAVRLQQGKERPGILEGPVKCRPGGLTSRCFRNRLPTVPMTVACAFLPMPLSNLWVSPVNPPFL